MALGGIARIAAAALLTAGAGCTTLRFETGSGPAGDAVRVERGGWLFGLGDERVEDVAERCPHGVVRITETTTAADALTTIGTLGVWWPRTIVYECRGAPSA